MNSSTRVKKLHLIFDGKTVPTPADRAWALSESGVSQMALAKKLGVSFEAVHRVIYDKSASYNIASKIAAVTGLTLKRLWPCGKYDLSPAERRARARAQTQTQTLKEAA